MIDDTLDNRLVMINLLVPLGFEVFEAEGGDSGVATACEVLPDLIVMDLVMPGMSGLECTRRIRRRPALQKTPVVMASASIFPADKQRSLDAGATSFMPKPIDSKVLQECLGEQLALSWHYEKPRPAAVPAENEPLTPPAPAQASELYELAMRGDISEIFTYLERLEATRPELQAFAAKIRGLAKEFREEEICELMEQWM